jgi:hypothetical protein
VRRTAPLNVPKGTDKHNLFGQNSSLKKPKDSSPKIERPADVSALISGYEKESREADAKLSDARKKKATSKKRR